jgi:hypothetical protein
VLIEQLDETLPDYVLGTEERGQIGRLPGTRVSKSGRVGDSGECAPLSDLV